MKKGDAQVSIPKNKLIKTEVSEKIFITKKNTPIKSNGKVLRNLSLGEQVTLTQDRNDGYVVKTKDGTLPDRTFEEAGNLAAFYSKGRTAPKVEIDYLQKKNVKKPAGAKPGFVVYYTNYSLMASPDIAGIQQLS